MTNARVAILGATGYGGGELLRLLLRHPKVDIAFATSRSREGVPVGAVHRNLDGLTDLRFSSPSVAEIAACDIVFGALPHGASAEALAPVVLDGARVIDLSGDFRLRDAQQYRAWYKREHPYPDLLARAVYGCPEANRDAIRSATLVASPGCFATAINLALIPAASRIEGTPTVVAMTGSSGSGAEASEGTHHPTRSGTLRPYKVLGHQHVPEILQLARELGSELHGLEFTPVSAPLSRGIVAVATADLARRATTEELVDAYAAHYADHPFVKVVTSREPECGPVATTNYVEVRPRATASGRLHVTCAIDNLVKGGAGQAVQSMNLMLGLAETMGLDWPGTWP
ncbi:MAG: N-acetyl-gamma-glutamyl-phosphate reductase [Myxococcales bacterium]|nr:N-acetyl-gamma-glutamyl-phosphate reductase [Myxococcales bacterium]MCB9531904.1 N-acetyl-gamma-glutamyl-phosphate reductase [Myxococcales bacterium]MCB9533872.1 N-acetyl-gamma-glutamyl-phosphate reductase [Myxococcales bacterium]